MGITYYDTGTATLSVGSKTMTGQGTFWAGWVKPGDQVLPQEGTSGVVDAVVSNTEITLKNPYRGVAQAAQPYTIMRTPDVVFTESLARQVLQKVNDSTLVALAGLPPVARTGFRFDANKIAETFPLSDKGVELIGKNDEATMLTFLGVSAFIKGLLDDVDAATARATLGANNASNLTTGTLLDALVSATLTPDKAFRRGNINGTVSMSGGVPTGALFEGGIASGRGYLRFANGMQICWGAPGTQMNPTNVATGGGYQATSGNTYGFVAAFTLAPTVVAGASFSSTARGWVSLLDVPTTTSVSLIAHSFASGALIVPYYMAIGWWF